MGIYELTDSVLSQTKLPFYYGIPEFAEGEEPSEYLTYEETEAPENFGDGEEHCTTYHVTVNLIHPKTDLSILKKVKKLFKEAGFTFIDGAKIDVGKSYPFKIQHYQEYLITLQEE